MTERRLAAVDIAKHQHPVDFARMRRAGVEGVILRVCHGDVVDSSFAELFAGANRVFGDDIAFYVFYNPNRATAAVSAAVFVDTVRRVVGTTAVGFMLDIEAYAKQKPVGPELPPKSNAAYIRRLGDEVTRLAPKGRVFAYSNAAYWNRAVGDDRLAASMEWIVPRYPVYPPSKVTDPKKGGSPKKLDEWLRTSPKPGKPPTWEQFAFEHADGPKAPRGVNSWAGWQFSAGYNVQGSTYGVSSRDLDLNIISPEVWRNWTIGGDGVPRVPAAPAAPAVNTLHSGEQLLPGQARVNGAGRLTHQTDGNVVLRVEDQPVWSTRTNGRTTKTFIMQGDGNLVLYAANGKPLWNSRTFGNPGAELFVTGDTIEVQLRGDTLWSSDDEPPPQPAVAVDPAGRRTIVVIAGEGWFQVARRAGIGGANWPKLAEANGGRERVIHPGDVLVLP